MWPVKLKELGPDAATKDTRTTCCLHFNLYSSLVAEHNLLRHSEAVYNVEVKRDMSLPSCFYSARIPSHPILDMRSPASHQ
jgi:hypothetical protein